MPWWDQQWSWKTIFLKSDSFFKIWHSATVYFCWRGGRLQHRASSKELKRKKWDWGTTSHLVVHHNQCLAWTIFGHWSLQHHAGPAVLLSQHCALGRDRIWLKLWIRYGRFELLIIWMCHWLAGWLSCFHLLVMGCNLYDKQFCYFECASVWEWRMQQTQQVVLPSITYMGSDVWLMGSPYCLLSSLQHCDSSVLNDFTSLQRNS